VSPSFPGAGPPAVQQGAPALTCWHVLLLLASVLPQKPLTPEEAFERVQSRQRRNHAAYLSHRKRILERLDGL
jgi:hypothetical protein